MSDLRKNNGIPDVNGNGGLKLIQKQLDLHEDYLKRIDDKLDNLVPELAQVKERTNTNRWLVGLLIVAFFGLAGTILLKVF